MDVGEAVRRVSDDLHHLFGPRKIQIQGVYVRKSLNSGGRPLLVVTGDVTEGPDTGPFFYVFRDDTGELRRRIVDGFHEVANEWRESANAFSNGEMGGAEPIQAANDSAPDLRKDTGGRKPSSEVRLPRTDPPGELLRNPIRDDPGVGR